MRNVSVKGGTLLLASIEEQPPLERQLARIRKRLSTGLLRPGAQTFLVNIDHLQALTVKHLQLRSRKQTGVAAKTDLRQNGPANLLWYLMCPKTE